MRARIPLTFAVAGLSVVMSTGCSSKSRDRSYASTVAPTTSSTPAPTNSGTAPVSTGTTPVTPPAPTMLTDALVSSFSLKQVIQVDAATGQQAGAWNTGNGPADVANHGFDTYVANAISQDITVVDRMANGIAGTIDVTAAPITGLSFLTSFVDPILKPLVRPTGLAVNPAGTKIYSANLLNVTISNAQTLQPTKSILGLSPLSLTSLISNPQQALSNFLAAPVQGLGMAKVAATNDHALVTCMITGKVMRIDGRTDSLIDYVDVGRAPVGITIARGKAYVACVLSQDIYVIDVATGAQRARLTAGMIPFDCASNQAGDKVYVANAISGDLSVIDTAADLVVDTLPAGLSIAQIFSQLGVTVPTGSGGGIGGVLNGFLQGFTGGMSNPSSFGALLTGGSSSLLSPGNLINGLISGFLAYAGVNSSAIAGMNLPGIGIFSVAVAHDPDLICTANALMGDLAATRATARSVNSVQGLTGLGPADVTTVWRQ